MDWAIILSINLLTWWLLKLHREDVREDMQKLLKHYLGEEENE